MKKTAVFALALIFVIAVSTLGFVSVTENYFFTKNLKVTTVAQSDYGLPEFD